MSWTFQTGRHLLTGLAAAAVLGASALAGDFGPRPADYQTAVEDYMEDRMADPRAARYQFTGAPYRVYADIKGHRGLACWAVDVRVKARMRNGGYGGYIPYTVLFLDGEPVALEDDARRVDPV